MAALAKLLADPGTAQALQDAADPEALHAVLAGGGQGIRRGTAGRRRPAR